jgi:hypothetical protein
MSYQATNYADLWFKQGEDFIARAFSQNKDGTKGDLSGWTAKGSMKKTYNTDSSEAVGFGIAIDVELGTVNFSLTNQQTSNIKRGNYVYDIFLYGTDSDGNGVTDAFLEGTMRVDPSATRG